MSNSVERLCLEEALEDSPQTRNFVNIFQEDAEQLRKYTSEFYGCCEDLYKAQLQICSATKALCEIVRKFEGLSFPLDRDDGSHKASLMQFADYLEEMGYLHNNTATQMCENVLGPVNKLLSCDYEALNGMKNMYDMITEELDQSLARYLKLPKKASEQTRLEAAEDVYQMRRKFHLSAMQYYSSLNTLQYRRHYAFLESLIGHYQTYRDASSNISEKLSKKNFDEFVTATQVKVKETRNEMVSDASTTEALIISIDEQCTPLYNPELVPVIEETQANPHLMQKAGYLFIRSKQGLLGPPRWNRVYFFTQGGNLMSQNKGEIAGQLVLDLNEEGVFAEVTDIDDRRNVFHIVAPQHKKTVVLQAENEKDRDEWVAALTNIMFESGFVRNRSQSSDSPQRRKPFSLPLFGRSNSQPADDVPPSGPADSRPAGSENPLPPGFLDAIPIQFDLTTPMEERQPATGAGEGGSGRKNPFDEALRTSDGAAQDSEQFSKTFSVRFMGSVQVPNDRGEALVTEAIRHIMTARAIHNVFRMPDLVAEVSSARLALLDPGSRTSRMEFGLEDVAFWSTHRENSRLLALITRRRAAGGPPVFTCHVFECHEDGEEVCAAIRTATKLAFQALVQRRASADKRAQETELLLSNISALPNKVEDLDITGAEGDPGRSTAGDGDERRVEGAECQSPP